MARAIWNNSVLAEAPDDRVQIVEGNVYFPPDTVHRQYLRASDSHSECPWKGTASYYDVVVDGRVNRDAAWYYPEPKQAAKDIANYIAFWRGVRVDRNRVDDPDRDSSATKYVAGEKRAESAAMKNDL